MAVQFVGGQVGNRAGSTSTSSINYALTGGLGEATPKAGDLVLIQVVVGSVARNPACAVTAPATWAAYGQLNPTATTQDTSMDVSRKFMGATPDTSFTLPSTGNNADAQTYTVRVYRGVDPASPNDVTATSATGTGTSRPNPPSITPTTAGTVIVCFGGGSALATTAFAFADLTNVIGDVGSDTNDSAAYSGHKTDWTSGAFDCAVSTSGSANAADSWAAYTIALRPLAAISTVTEDFEATLDTGKWTESTTNGTVTFGTGGVGELNITTSAIANQARVDLIAHYNLIGSEVYIKIPQAMRVSGDVSGVDTTFDVAIPGGGAVQWIIRSNGDLIAAKFGTDLEIITSSYWANQSDYRWFRFRESGGTLHWDRAPESASNPPSGGDWVNEHSELLSSFPSTLSDCTVDLFCWMDTARTVTQSAKFDGLNTAATSSGTAVGADLAGSYAVVSAVGADHVGSYGIVAVVGQDLSGAYGIVHAVQADHAGAYAVIEAVGADLAGAYGVGGTVSADHAGAYSVVEAVGQNHAGSYAIVSAVSADCAGSYSIVAAVGEDGAGAYAILNAAGQDMGGGYAVIEAIFRDLDCAYLIDGEQPPEEETPAESASPHSRGPRMRRSKAVPVWLDEAMHKKPGKPVLIEEEEAMVLAGLL